MDLAYANRGVWGNEPEAACWIMQSASAGNTDAYASVGRTYEKGLGVATDMAEAIAWYRKAIDAGRSAGAYRLALLYRDGRGVAADSATSKRYFRLQSTLKQTEPKYDSDSTVERKFKSIYRALTHADRHLLRVFKMNGS